MPGRSDGEGQFGERGRHAIQGRGHYELATDATALDRVAVAFTERALAI